MAAGKHDPTEALRLEASRYPGVVEGTSCTQSSFKTAKGAILYVGMQGGRYKAMFKLKASAHEAARLAEKEPERFDVGSTAWVTARFTAERPMPQRLWKKWLDESYELSLGAAPSKKATKKATKKAPEKATKKTVKKTSKKTAGKGGGGKNSRA